MDFNLSEEQDMIRDSIARFVDENYDLDKRNAVVAKEHGFSKQHWQDFAELGWLSIPFGEDLGGFGGGPVETMVIMQEFGRGLVAEPYLATVLLFGGILQECASPAIREELIPQILGGELQGAFAYHERQSRYEIADVATTARQESGNWVLDGNKSVVLNGGAAEKFIVLARTSGNQFDEKGLTLFLVDGAADGLERVCYRMTDGKEAANLNLSGVVADAVIGNVGDAVTLMSPVIDHARLAICAEALGAMESLLRQTIDYCKNRKQFGVAISSFQALQHRMVDMFGACENVKSLLYRAVCMAGGDDARRSLLALKVMTGRAGRLVGSEAIQMHGGMGVSDDLAIGHYVKRLMVNNSLFGDSDFHQAVFAEIVNAPAEGAGDLPGARAA